MPRRLGIVTRAREGAFTRGVTVEGAAATGRVATRLARGATVAGRSGTDVAAAGFAASLAGLCPAGAAAGAEAEGG